VTLSDVAFGKNFYDILGVDSNASQDDIRAAYKNRIRETHPDLNQSPEAADEFMEVQEAFRWLSDPGQRDVYDSVGGKFGQDAIYDYTDESILGRLDEIQKIPRCLQATAVVNECHLDMISKSRNNQVRIDFSIVDIRKRFRKFGNDRIAFVRKRLCGELRAILEYASLINKLHPFERLSVELTLTQHVEEGGAPFGQLLGAVKQLRQTICEEAASSGKACRTARRGRESTFIADAAIERMYELFTSYAPVFHQISSAQIALLRSPCIDLDKPTIVFVGAPNVGKSSLVRSISTGKAEVNNYCFTTKQLTIGHLWHFIAGTPLLIHGQIVDSPGMRGLWEPNNKKYNLFDQLTLGSMEHLPTGVVFTFDPYPVTHGILSITEQVELRNQLRAKFPKRPWLDVITKVDRVEPEAVEGIATLSRLFPDALRVSALEGTGLAELNMAVRGLLEEMTRVVRQLQRAKIRQLRAGRSDEGFVSKEALVLR
jgi:nucleolar GTP-binding protein